MLNITGVVLVLASAFLIAVADALIKKTSAGGSFYTAVFNPWMLVILALYFVQILLAVYIFIHKGNLAVYGNIFVVFYAILMVVLGVAVFREQLTLVQGIGIALALAGAVMINGGF